MAQHRARRFGIGSGLVLLILIIGFGTANGLIPTWGSTPAVQSRVLPGDEIFSKPVLKWEHAITIDAAPEEVWPWLIQMGDTSGGYYSYRLIEKAVTAMAGIDVSNYYPNTNRIHPEWQSPEIGQGMIMDVLVLRDYKVNEYIVAGPNPEMGDAGLLWTWALAPTGDGRSRLLVHMRIQIPGTQGNRAVEAALNLSTFMMERKMMEGIKLRAEGGSEADWVQWAEAVIWFTVLGMGLVAARRYVTQAEWKLPLAAGMLAVIGLFGLVYLQPAIWLRLVLVVVLLAVMEKDRWVVFFYKMPSSRARLTA